jgi:hypothetical protein
MPIIEVKHLEVEHVDDIVVPVIKLLQVLTQHLQAVLKEEEGLGALLISFLQAVLVNIIEHVSLNQS